MADDIITRLRQHLTRRDITSSTHWDGCIDSHPICALAWALDQIETLRALCNDLHHDATCTQPFCRLCGEGIREWEARRD